MASIVAGGSIKHADCGSFAPAFPRGCPLSSTVMGKAEQKIHHAATKARRLEEKLQGQKSEANCEAPEREQKNPSRHLIGSARQFVIPAKAGIQCLFLSVAQDP
jgi:hypothetical protein